MKFRNLTIRKLLSFFAVFIALILLFIGLLTNQSIQSTFFEFSTLSSLQEIANAELAIRKAEKEFLASETKNPNFYKSGKSDYLKNIEGQLKYIHAEINIIMQSPTIKDLELDRKLEYTNELFQMYENNLEKMSANILKKGFKDYGLIGNMRDQIHKVENRIELSDNLRYAKHMLMLRRHEKDYLLRSDLKYQQKFSKEKEAFISTIKKNGDQDIDLIDLLTKYHEVFDKVIQIDINIGLKDDSGINKQINETIAKIEQNIEDVTVVVDKASRTKINKTILNLFIILFVASLIIVFALVKISRHIVKSIANLSSYITCLGHGELPEEIKIYNNDEIAHMKASINILTKNLKNTKDFAIAVGNGNFEQEVDVFGNEGDLGSALVEMREKLLQVSDERNKQMLESEQRLWANDGFNNIHQIISASAGKEEEFHYKIVAQLVKFINANQGSLFLADEIEGEMILNQKATFAFDRNRLNKREIKIGEGLIGAVAYEKDSIYMTKVPEDYINITSGLGDATPRALLIVPCISEGELMAVIELASFEEIDDYKVNFVKRVAEDIANSLRKIKIEETTKLLLDKTQKQTSELYEKEEEMRQNLEELTATQEAMKEKENNLMLRIQELEKENEHLKNK
jgi:methyl-accepting chemotaxis protein